MNVDQEIEVALSLCDGSFFAEVAGDASIAIPASLGNHEQVDIGLRVRRPQSRPRDGFWSRYNLD
jgi:hypothetical protein